MVLNANDLYTFKWLMLYKRKTSFKVTVIFQKLKELVPLLSFSESTLQDCSLPNITFSFIMLSYKAKIIYYFHKRKRQSLLHPFVTVTIALYIQSYIFKNSS